MKAVRIVAAPGREPSYASPGSSGADLRADIDEPVTLKRGDRYLVPTGVRIELPPNTEGQVRPRSGLAVRHGITILNAPGTIDSDYRGEIKVPIINHGKDPFVVEPGMRIAQLVFAPVTQVNFEVTSELNETGRGSGGFGSTGTA